MTMYSPDRKGRVRGRTRRGRLLAAFTIAAAVALLPAIAVVSPANAVPKGTLAADKSVGLVPGQNVNLTLTNYPAEDVLVKYCVLTGPGLTVGECAPAPATVAVPDKAGGRGDTTSTVAAVKMIGASDCTSATICGIVTESAGTPQNPDSAAKLPVAFGGVPALEVLDRAPTAANNSPVTVKGTGFRPNTPLRLTQCNNSLPAGGKCRTTLNEGYAEPTTDANGAFQTELNVSASYVSGADTLKCTDGSIVCGLQTSSKTSGADRTQQSMVDLDFGGTLTASKVTGLSPDGESITAKGTGFEPDTNLFLVNCDTAVPAGGTCDMAHVEQVHTDAAGAFNQAITVGSFPGTDCLVKACGLQTSKIGNGADVSQAATLPLSFTAPAQTAKITSSKTSGISMSGETLQVTGTGFKPKISLYLALCNTDVPAGGACDMSNFKTIQTDGSGAFPKTSIKVAGSFTGGDGSKVNCLDDPCALQTSRVGMGSDATQIATLPLRFVTGPGAKPSLVAPKVVKSGSTVTAKGRHFTAGDQIVTALCKTSAKVGKQCWTAKARTAKVQRNGTFTAKIKVAKTFASKQGKVNCGTSKCAIKTWNKRKPTQRSSQVTHKVRFGNRTARARTGWSALTPVVVKTARSGESLSVSKTSGLSPAGESVTVKGSGFNPNVGLFIALCNTDVPNGGACDMSNFKQVRTDGSGSFPSTSIKVVGTFTGGDGSAVDCASDPCALQSSQVGSGATGVVTVPMKFAAGSTGGDPSDGDGSGGGGTSSGGTSGGTSSGGTSSGGTSDSGSGTGLPQTGAGNELWLAAVGLLLLVGGLALSLRRTAPVA